MNKRVVITGLGVVSSIGVGKDTFWGNIINGVSGISPVTSFDTSDHFTHNGGEAKCFMASDFFSGDELKQFSRATQMGLAASILAINDAQLNIDNDNNIAVCLGTTVGSTQVIEHINNSLINDNSFPFANLLFGQLITNSTPAAISEYFNLCGSNYLFSTACAAGNYAIGFGIDLIKSDQTEIVITGGYEPFSRISFTGFNQFSAVAPEKCQPFDKNRKGMIVAEGSGILILESLEHAKSRGATIYAELLAYGLSCDAKHMTNPSVDGIATCMTKALEGANISTEDVDYISAHGTGTVSNDKTECAAIKKVFGQRYKKIPVSSIKSMLGHTMGAASAIETIACALAIRNDIIPPTINFETPDPECDIDCVPNKARDFKVNIALNNSYAFGGNNASLVLKKYIS